MAERSGGADECGGLDLPAVGCLGTGNPGSDAILALVPVLFGLWMMLLSGETWRIRIGLWLYDASWSTAYAGLLQKLLVRLSWLFGRPWSPRALDTCFRLAVVYAVAYTYFGIWMDSSDDAKANWVFALEFFVLGPITFVIAYSVRHRHVHARRRVKSRIRRIGLHLREQLAYIVVTGTVVIVVGAILGIDLSQTGAVGAAIAEAAPRTIAVGAAVAVAVAAPVAAAGTVAAAVPAAVAVALVGAEVDIVRFAAVIFIIIPGLNALFDWPSWAASRWLMGRLRADATRPRFFQRAGALLGHLLLDCAIAIACLFGLAIVLINVVHALEVAVLWNKTLSAARDAPFSGQGSTMTVMLLSTLVPTVLHLFFALFALAAIRPPYRKWFVGWIEDRHGGNEWGNRAIVSAYLTFWVVFALVVLWVASVFVLRGLDWLWLRLGWGLETDPNPFWASIFKAAEWFVIF